MQLKNYSHWLFQILPPISVLFFLSENGPALSHMIGLWGLFASISFVSIIMKLYNFKKKKKYLPRPVLTCLVLFVLVILALTSYNTALNRAQVEARQIAEMCKHQGRCPIELPGWEKSSRNTLNKKAGHWFKYPLIYRYSDQTFYIDIIQGTDLGDRISGGVGKELKTMRMND